MQADVLLQLFQAVEQMLRLPVRLRDADVGRVFLGQDALEQRVRREDRSGQRGRLVGGDLVQNTQQAESVSGRMYCALKLLSVSPLIRPQRSR